MSPHRAGWIGLMCHHRSARLSQRELAGVVYGLPMWARFVPLAPELKVCWEVNWAAARWVFWVAAGLVGAHWAAVEVAPCFAADCFA